MTPNVLIACVGNIFLGDDAFGVEVARRLAPRARPEGVRLVDFGIRGFDLALALLDDGTDVVILVDAVPLGGTPGTLYVIEPEWDNSGGPGSLEDHAIETHTLDPAKVFRLVLSLGGHPKPVLLVGCEPSPLGEDDEPTLAMSAAVRDALDEAVRLVESLVAQVREERGVSVAR